MAEQIIERRDSVQQVPGGAVREQVTSTDDRVSSSVLGERVVNGITGFILALLAIRFVLSLLGANQANGFAQFIYSVTYPLVAPFFGLFGYTFEYGVARFEIETVIAMLVYALVGYGISKLFTLGRAR
jgi:uncharacterized protein YggT (Ycf19 family)